MARAGGIDLNAGRIVAIRVFQIDYLLAEGDDVGNMNYGWRSG